jgi:hypothetical protein
MKIDQKGVFMFRKVQYLTIAGFLLFTAAGLSAQTAQELRLGSSISATLREGGEQWYSVRASEECFVVVEILGDFDTYLEVYDASNNLVAENDDYDSYNARVEFYAGSGRTYRVKLRGYDSYESGSYRIMASQKPIPRPVELRVGSSLSGNLSSGEDNWYRITPSGSGFLVVETLGDVDTYMEAYDSSYKFLSYNDDGGEDYNAKLEIFIESGKTYLFKVRGYNSYESGTFRIMASQTPPPSELRAGASVSGNIAGGESNWYRITPSRSGLLVIETSSNMDTYLEAYDTSNNFIDYDDDGGEDSNAMLFLNVESGKTYLIKIRGYDRYESGRYLIWARFEN